MGHGTIDFDAVVESVPKKEIESDQGNISVLITTYFGESPANLDEALRSIYKQSLRPREVVLVVDGPIPKGQEEVIIRYQDQKDITLHVIRLPKNVGRGAAKNVGIERCCYEFIAVMDSDDISVPQRLEKQFNLFQLHPEYDVIAGWQLEFDDETKKETLVKRCPKLHVDIVRALKWRNVVPNPAVMIRRENAVKVGGYGDFKTINEDYDLFLKLIEAGARFHNIQEILIRVRTSREQRKRRGGWNVIKDDFKFRYRHYQNGFYGFWEVLLISAIYFVFRLMPANFKDILYRISRSI